MYIREIGSMSKLVGVFLVKNEENFIAWSLMNVVNSCDHIIVLDNLSTDRTKEIVQNIAGLHSNIEIIDVKNANKTQMYLEQYFGTETWVLGVDGDEVHDPIGLVNFGKRLRKGEFDKFWSVSSTYLHVTEFDFSSSVACGYISPPAKAGLKLYNFNAIENWQSKWRKRERLHGKGLVFRDGYSKQQTYSFSKQASWEVAEFRCLHLCFLQRSSIDTNDYSFNNISVRKNPAETKLLRRVARKIERMNPNSSDYRTKRYARGSVGQFDIANFGKPNDFRLVDSRCDDVMNYLQNAKINI